MKRRKVIKNLGLGAGLLGALTTLWSIVLFALFYYTLADPSYQSTSLDIRLFPSLPIYFSRTLETAAGIIGLLVVYAIGQLILPVLYVGLAQRRLDKIARSEDGRRLFDG